MPSIKHQAYTIKKLIVKICAKSLTHSHGKSHWLYETTVLLNCFMYFHFISISILQGMRMTGEDSETLHLTHLERESTGAYLCSASNTEGETRSSSLYLKVQCKYIFFLSFHFNPILCRVILCLQYISYKLVHKFQTFEDA